MIVRNETVFSKPQKIIRRLLRGECTGSLLREKSLRYFKENIWQEIFLQKIEISEEI